MFHDPMKAFTPMNEWLKKKKIKSWALKNDIIATSEF